MPSTFTTSLPPIYPAVVILGSEAQSEVSTASDKDNPSGSRSETPVENSVIPKVIGGTFAPITQAGKQPKRARAKRSWVWDWGVMGESNGDKTWTCTLCK